MDGARKYGAGVVVVVVGEGTLIVTLPTGVNKQAVIYHIYSGIRFVYCERYSVFSVTNKGSVR